MTSSQKVRPFDVSLGRLLSDSLHSDFVINCQDESFNVHKCILSLRSGFFARALKEGRWKEGTENSMTLGDDDAGDRTLIIETSDTIDLMVRFMYAGEYTIEFDEATMCIPSEELQLHAALYALGDKYDVVDMKKYAEQSFLQAIKHDGSWNMASLAKTIRFVFSTTPSTDTGLRQLTMPLIRKFWSTLNGTPDFDDMLRDVPGFATFVLDNSIRAEPSGPTCLTCRQVQLRTCRSSKHGPGTTRFFITCACYGDQKLCDQCAKTPGTDGNSARPARIELGSYTTR